MAKEAGTQVLLEDNQALCGAGIGLRREIVDDLLASPVEAPRFVEFAPENWIGVGGYWGRVLRQIAERYPITSHGLSLSIGSPEPLDWDFLRAVRQFLRDYQIAFYSEHLSYTKCSNAHVYDLLPIPFREDSVKHVAQRIREVQDFLERKIAIENVSYYTPLAPEMDEATFLRSVVEEADCNLLLDVNNVYVNAFNHGYDARSFIERLPLERVAYIHMAGHLQVEEDLIVDTHGEPIIDPVFELFEWTVPRINPVPVLLERDFNLPPYAELASEMTRMQKIMDSSWAVSHAS